MKHLIGTTALALVLAGCAHGQVLHGEQTNRFQGGSLACPYGFVDGCPQAPVNPSYFVPSLLTTATQNGQPSTFHRHDMARNLPGIDYGEGYTLGTLIPASSFPVTGPCQYQPTGGGPQGLAPRIYCNGANPDVENVDFTNGGTDCVTLEFSSGTTGKVIGHNLRFGAGYQCGATTASSDNGWDVFVIAPATGIAEEDWSNIEFDGNPPGCTNCYTNPMPAAIVDHSQGAHTLNIWNFAAVKIPGRVVNYLGNPTLFSMHNGVVNGFNYGYPASLNHGELAAPNVNTTSTGNTIYMNDLLVVVPNDTPLYTGTPRGGAVAAAYLSAGFIGPRFSSVEVDNTELITNCSNYLGTGCFASMNAGLFEVAYNQIDSAVFNNDGIDPNGSQKCSAVAASVGLVEMGGSGYATNDTVLLSNGSTIKVTASGGVVTSATLVAGKFPAPSAMGTAANTQVSTSGSGLGLVVDIWPAGPGVVAPTFNHVVNYYDGSTLTGWDTGACNGAAPF